MRSGRAHATATEPVVERLAAAAAAAAARFPGPPAAALANLRVELDEDFCRDVAARYDRAPRFGHESGLRRAYDVLADENLALLRASGVRVRPWAGPGQPYRDSAELIGSVRRTGELSVFLSSVGHGPDGETGYHPLRRPSGLVVDGVPLSHNDIFRAVHDLFGHVLFGYGFGPRGEFKATCCQLRLYPEEVHQVVFTEQIGQLCWFFYGPHVLDAAGRPLRPGAPGYRAPPDRPYAEQKLFLFGRPTLERFRRTVRPEETT